MNASTPTATAVPTLVMSGVSKRFGGVVALDDVSLEVLPGEVHALLGENGAGKSTLMNVASGTIRPDSGTIAFAGEAVQHLDPAEAARLGIAFVHQHPAVMPDLTVLDNLRVSIPRAAFGDGPVRAAATAMIDRVGVGARLDERVENLTVAQAHLLEIAKALAMSPRLLILDEPTAPLDPKSVDRLFDLVRDLTASGTSVVYITHRMAEVRQLADRVTVMRDGKYRITSAVADITDDELLALIVGRQLESTFPPKHAGGGGETILEVAGLDSDGVSGVSFSATRGEIVGIAGVSGNGQSELLRALGGLQRSTGRIDVAGEALSSAQLLKRAAYLPADRQREGILTGLSVRENAAVSALGRFVRGIFLSGRAEQKAVDETVGALRLKAASTDATLNSLSGGNQQKVMVARALLSEPALVLADEPTQGVDVGARAEIYDILRSVSSSGVPVVVASSDAKELEGLCDTVVVMSRGYVVETLRGDDIREDRMIAAAVGSTTTRVTAVQSKPAGRAGRLRRFMQSDYAPSVLLVAVILGLGAFILAQNGRYLGDFNVASMLTLATALGFVALGQTIALLTGGIDLSVGPLAGFAVVVGSFFLGRESPLTSILFGLVVMLVVTVVVGLVNGSLIRFGKFTPIAATLVTYIALQGLSFVLRPNPDGYFDRVVTDVVTFKLGPIPVAFIVLVGFTIALEFALRSTRWGWQLRAVGSDEESARRVGIRVNRTVVLGYVATSVLTFFGALMLMAQVGIGDPAQGVSYTLTSITAVVLGGTSLLGGRGTFVGTLLGALLLIQVMNATVFLNLDQMWQYILQGGLILVAAVIYAVSRSRRRRAAVA